MSAESFLKDYWMYIIAVMVLGLFFVIFLAITNPFPTYVINMTILPNTSVSP